MRPFFAFFLIFGLVVFAGSLFGAIFLDWPALQKADAAFLKAAAQNARFETLFALEARQNIHRINLFADGVWCLLGAILGVFCAAQLKKNAPK